MARTDFGSHTYWRIVGVFNTFVAFSALLFKDNTGSLITVSGGSVIESGHFSTFSASNLFDGTDSTFWESTNIPCSWAGYQFGSAKTVMQMAVQRHGTTMDGTAPPKSFIFQYSDDGVVWGTVGFGNSWSNSSTEMPDDTPYWFDFSQCL